MTSATSWLGMSQQHTARSLYSWPLLQRGDKARRTGVGQDRLKMKRKSGERERDEGAWPCCQRAACTLRLMYLRLICLHCRFSSYYLEILFPQTLSRRGAGETCQLPCPKPSFVHRSLSSYQRKVRLEQKKGEFRFCLKIDANQIVKGRRLRLSGKENNFCALNKGAYNGTQGLQVCAWIILQARWKKNEKEKNNPPHITHAPYKNDYLSRIATDLNYECCWNYFE